MGKLNDDTYYFCGMGKPTATLAKIRRYCHPQGCMHLQTRGRKKGLRKALQKQEESRAQAEAEERNTLIQLILDKRFPYMADASGEERREVRKKRQRYATDESLGELSIQELKIMATP
jgi:hypothetical protein